VKIDVSDLRREKGQTEGFEGKIRGFSLKIQGIDVNFCDLEITGQATNTGEGIFVQGIIKTQADLNCSLCLKAFSSNLEVSFKETYYREGDSIAEALEDDAMFYHGEKIELDDLIVDDLLLAIPMKPVCNPDCKGLCPVCGNDLNVRQCQCRKEEIDPRLAVLGTLLKNSKNG
jgi:uncharacterized protein